MLGKERINIRGFASYIGVQQPCIRYSINARRQNISPFVARVSAPDKSTQPQNQAESKNQARLSEDAVPIGAVSMCELDHWLRRDARAIMFAV